MAGTAREIFVLISETMSELAASDLRIRLSSVLPEFSFQLERRAEFNLPFAVCRSTYRHGRPLSLMECHDDSGQPVVLVEDPDVARVNATLDAFTGGAGI